MAVGIALWLVLPNGRRRCSGLNRTPFRSTRKLPLRLDCVEKARWSLARWSLARWSLARWSLARWSLARWSLARWSLARWSLARWSLSQNRWSLEIHSATARRAALECGPGSNADRGRGATAGKPVIHEVRDGSGLVSARRAPSMTLSAGLSIRPNPDLCPRHGRPRCASRPRCAARPGRGGRSAGRRDRSIRRWWSRSHRRRWSRPP